MDFKDLHGSILWKKQAGLEIDLADIMYLHRFFIR